MQIFNDATFYVRFKKNWAKKCFYQLLEAGTHAL